MQDRAPLYPGRVQLTPVPGQANKYDTVRADEPTQAGDALNKANLLPDDVAAALELTGNPQVKDALSKLKTLADIGISRAQIVTGSYTGTGAYGASNPNVLNLNGAPQIVLIYAPNAGSYGKFGFFLVNSSTYIGFVENSSYYQFSTSYAAFAWHSPCSVSGNTLSWYNDHDAGSQFNENRSLYFYAAVII